MSLRSTARSFVVAFAVATLVVGLALPALAHHPEVTASVNCTGLVSYTATAWADNDPLRREHHDIRIDVATSVDGVNWSAYTQIDTGQFLPNDFSFSDTYQLSPVPEFVKVQARSIGNWGPEGEFEVADTLRESQALEIPLCPANPTALAVTQCDLNGAKLTFTNTGGEPATFNVLRNGTAEAPVTVAGGGQETRSYTMVEDSTATFLVTSGEYSTTSTLTFNCLPAVLPAAGVSNVSPAAQVAGDVLPATGPHDLVYLAVALLLVLAGRGVLSSENLGAGKRF